MMRCVIAAVLLVAILSAIIADASFIHRRRRIDIRRGNLTLQDGDSGQYTKWFTQKLDHFDEGNSATWQQRYFVNDEYFDKENRKVAFLRVGEEAEINDVWMTSGDWAENGAKFGAILFYMEHRFYGKSRPTKDLSVESLQYLRIEQSLEDIYDFVTAMNTEYNLPPDVKWIAFGGSYPAELAAWARLQYPQLIQGAVSSSAPLLKVVNYEGYFQVVADDLRNVSEDCYNAVKKAFTQVDALIRNKAGQKTLTSKFQLCDPLEENANDDRDIAVLYEVLASTFAVTAQYNNINGPDSINLDTACAIMTDSSRPKEIDRLAAFNALLSQESKQTCTPYKYSYWIDSLRSTTWDETGERQWLYQTCSQIGEFQTSDGKPQIFGNKFPLYYSILRCTDIFGEGFDQAYIQSSNDYLNNVFGGLNINVTNVVFVHGSVDPFYKLGITQTVNPDAPAIFIEGTAHCADMYSPSEYDLPQLTEARAQISQLIQSWLGL